MPVTGCRRPRGDDERERQLGRSPRRHAQQRERQLVGPLGVVEDERERLLVGQLDDQPPQRVHDLVATRAEPARIRQRSLERQHTQPRRTVGRDVAGRPAEQHPRAGERHAGLDLVRGRVQDRSPASSARARASPSGASCRSRPPLRSARPALPGGRRADDLVEDGQLGLALDQHVHTSSLLPRTAGRQPSSARYRGRYRARSRRGRSRRRRRLRHRPKGTPMIARLAEHSHLPADLDPGYVARHRAWIAAQPGILRRLPPARARDRTRAVADHVAGRRRARRRRPRARPPSKGPADGRLAVRPSRPSASSKSPPSSDPAGHVLSHTADAPPVRCCG